MTNSDTESGAGVESEAAADVLSLFLAQAKNQEGDRFKMGASTSVRDADPDAFDASELVKWAAGRAGVTVRDGSWHQYQDLHAVGADVDVQAALDTPGALVFRFPDDAPDDPSTWKGRPPGSHVAISLGGGKVLEATTGGVRIVEHGGRFTHGGSIPEITGTIEEADAATEIPSASDEHAAVDSENVDVVSDDVDEDVNDTVTKEDEPDEHWAEKALDLRKEALDAQQAAEQMRVDLEDAVERRDAIEDRLEDATSRASTSQAALFENAAQQLNAEAAVSEQLARDHAELQTTVALAHADVDLETGNLRRIDQGLADITQEANSLSDQSQALRLEALATVAGALPEPTMEGSGDVLGVIADPETLDGPVSPDRLRDWLAARNESANQREQSAERTLAEVEIDEDLADSYIEVAGEATARAATERVSIETDRALIERLEVRKAEAEALEQRLVEEVAQENTQFERLRQLDDGPAAEVASEHVTELLQQQFRWSGQAASLGERIDEKQLSITQAEADAADFDQLATDFTELAERHQILADSAEIMTAGLHDEIDRDDFITDKVEDALASSDASNIDADFLLIDGTDNTELHIEIDRDAPTAAPEPKSDEVDAPDAEAILTAALTETFEPDPDPNVAIVADAPDPIEVASPEEDDFTEQLDVIESLEDSLDDLLDDQA